MGIQQLCETKQSVIKLDSIEEGAGTNFVQVLQNVDVENGNDEELLNSYDNPNDIPIKVLATYTTTLEPGAQILIIKRNKKDNLEQNILGGSVATKIQYDIIDSNDNNETTEGYGNTKLKLMNKWLINSNAKLQKSVEKVISLKMKLSVSEKQKDLILKELLADYKVNNEVLNKDAVTQGIECIKKERNDMKNDKIKLNYSIPNATIVFIVISSLFLAFFSMSFILTVFKNIYIMHPFYSFSLAIGALGILVTSITSIKDWREFIKDVK